VSRDKVLDDAAVQKRIEKAEKKAQKLAGVDQGIIGRFWELVNLFPKISTPELEQRVDTFIMSAAPGQLFRMQQALFVEATPYLLEDDRVMRVMDDLQGKCIGLAISGEYESTVRLDCRCFQVTRGINDGIPVISVGSRKDYADAILTRVDPVKMILSRRIRASHKLTLLRWGLPHLDLLREKGLFEKYIAYQPEVEQVLEDYLTKLGY
jgi:hypothetical protein